MDNQPQGKTYICTGECQAVVSEEQYKNGLTHCGAEGCSMKGHPLVEGKRSEVTGKNEPTKKTE